MIAPLTFDGPQGQIVPSPDGEREESRPVHQSGANGTISDLWYKFANNAALLANHANGIFCRFDFGYDATALANA